MRTKWLLLIFPAALMAGLLASVSTRKVYIFRLS